MVGEQAGHGGRRWSVVATRAFTLFGTKSMVCNKRACLVHECTGVVGAVDGGLRLPHHLPALLHLRQLRELQHGTRTISRHKSNAVAMTVADQAVGRGGNTAVERSDGTQETGLAVGTCIGQPPWKRTRGHLSERDEVAMRHTTTQRCYPSPAMLGLASRCCIPY